MKNLFNTIMPLVCLVALFGCATNPVTGRAQLMLVSEQQEITMGKQAAPSLNWGFGGKYQDRELETYLGTIVKRIWSNSERPGLPVTFSIQNTSIPNAFAIPGYVAITRGLLFYLENEAQFAAIMGHETGHVMARHSASRISRGYMQQIGLGLAGTVLADTGGADALLALGSLGSSLLLLKYDRSQELEADRAGVVYSSRLGYDPNEAVTAHEQLGLAADDYLRRAGKTSQSGGFMSDILSTHPRKDVRVEEIRGMIGSLPPFQIQGDGKKSDLFMQRTAGLRKAQEAYVIYDEAEQAFEKKQYAEAEQLVNKAISMNARQAPFYSLRGMISLTQKNYTGAVRHFEKALSLDNEYQPAFFGIAVGEYKNSRPARALEHIKKSLSLYPGHSGSLYVAGLCNHDLNRPQEALDYFGTFAQRVKKHPDVYGYMGMNYEKTNKNTQAVEAYSAQLKIAPDNAMGIYAKKRLTALKGN
jgi:predicted Zn-dependent protease